MDIMRRFLITVCASIVSGLLVVFITFYLPFRFEVFRGIITWNNDFVIAIALGILLSILIASILGKRFIERIYYFITSITILFTVAFLALAFLTMFFWIPFD